MYEEGSEPRNFKSYSKKYLDEVSARSNESLGRGNAFQKPVERDTVKNSVIFFFK